MANAFWPTAVVGEADSVNSVSASACHIGGPKGVSPGQKALFHGNKFCLNNSEKGLPFVFENTIAYHVKLNFAFIN